MDHLAYNADGETRIGHDHRQHFGQTEIALAWTAFRVEVERPHESVWRVWWRVKPDKIMTAISLATGRSSLRKTTVC